LEALTLFSQRTKQQQQVSLQVTKNRSGSVEIMLYFVVKNVLWFGKLFFLSCIASLKRIINKYSA